MQRLRLRVKKEILLRDDFAPEGEEEFILNVGEEYDVRLFWEEQKTSNFTFPDEVYVDGHHGWNQMMFDSEKEFWEYWEFASMSELDFREIFDADNLTMESIREDVAFKECGLGYYEMAYSHMLESELDARGLALNEEIMTSESVIEYIMQMRHNGSRYTLEDWVRDTKENYPKCFM